jgi:hypothetical protein
VRRPDRERPLSSTLKVPDELDRLFSTLVANLAELDPTRLHRPFPVAELYESLVPYRTHRKALGVESGEDYEMTVLRLLAGERGYAVVEPDEVRQTLARAAESVNPETGAFRRFGNARVHLDPDRVNDALRGADREPGGGDEPPRPAADFEAATAAPHATTAADDAQAALPFVLDEEEEEAVSPVVARPRDVSAHVSAPCAYCGGELPVGRAVLFCPHCGQNVGVVHCPTCDAELDVGWRFCITCGQKVSGLG